MRYSPSHYARALVEALDAASGRARPETIRRFVLLLRKRGALRHLGRILNECEKLILRRSGKRKVEIQAAAPLGADVRRIIRRTLGKNIVATETVRQELLAGVRIIVDDEILIDASAKQQIEALFSR